MNRIYANNELTLRRVGLWEQVPHPWLDLFVPKSRISDFDEGVFKGILVKQNLSAPGILLVYPADKSKWDDRTSAAIPNEDFYIVSILLTAGYDTLELFQAQNRDILQFCVDADIGMKLYTPHNYTQEEWAEHFGPKWKTIQERKLQFDPNKILSPGQGIFN